MNAGAGPMDTTAGSFDAAPRRRNASTRKSGTYLLPSDEMSPNLAGVFGTTNFWRGHACAARREMIGALRKPLVAAPLA